jgi:hypothetical protein
MDGLGVNHYDIGFKLNIDILFTRKRHPALINEVP